MAYFVEVYCRLAIRLCVGYHANGRERYKTVNIWNIRRDATEEQIALFVWALAPLLDGEIVRVWVVRKDRLVMDGAARGAAAPRAKVKSAPSVAFGDRTKTSLDGGRRGMATVVGNDVCSASLFEGGAPEGRRERPLTLPLPVCPLLPVIANPAGVWQSHT